MSGGTVRARLGDAGDDDSGAGAWMHVCTIEVREQMLIDDRCRISLRRGPGADALRLQHAEVEQLDRLLEVPHTAGSDSAAARAALSAAAREGRIHLDGLVLDGGILRVEECDAIIREGLSDYQRALEEAHAEAIRAAHAAQERRPSRLLATAEELGLVPEPVGEHQWVANCPGAQHRLMLGTDTETFGCGYCKVKGGPEELSAFVARRRAARR